MSQLLLLSQKAMLPEAQSLALLQACFRLRPQGEASSYPSSHLHPWPTSTFQCWGERKGVEWETTPIGQPELKMPSRGGSWRGCCLARCSQPPASPSSPFLSSPFTNFSHVPAACAAAADSPVGRLPRIVCAALDDPRRPVGLRSPGPSIREGPARARSPPLPLGSPPRTRRWLSGSRAPCRSQIPHGLFPYLKHERTEPRDRQEPFSTTHSFTEDIY